MKSDKGPFQITEVDDESGDVIVEFRNYDCESYQTCLGLAAGLNWDGFSCRECVGQVNQTLLWQVRQMQRKDGLVKKLCDIPGAKCYESETSSETTPNIRLVSSKKSAANES